MVKLNILQEDTSYSFRSYFELTNDPDEILAEFGYALKQSRLNLPKSDRQISGLKELQQQLEDTLPFVQLSSETAFFNLGFLTIEHEVETSSLDPWLPVGTDLNAVDLVVVGNNDISMLHDMALYRQSRVRLADTEKKVSGGAFFNVEALPEGSIFTFPVAMKDTAWKPFHGKQSEELYFGGLESIGFGHCSVTLQEVNE